MRSSKRRRSAPGLTYQYENKSRTMPAGFAEPKRRRSGRKYSNLHQRRTTIACLSHLLKRVGIKLTLNDPRWGRKPEGDNKAQEGKRPGEGPPDLDQMWRDFNARLNRLFGQQEQGRRRRRRRRLRRRHEGRRRHRRRGRLPSSLLIWLASGAFIVQEGQAGVVTTFGQLQPHHRRRFQLALAVSVPGPRNGQRLAGAHRRNRLPRQRAQQAARRKR